MNVKLNDAEAFINFMIHHTDLYIRGERSADHKKAAALHKKLV